MHVSLPKRTKRIAVGLLAGTAAAALAGSATTSVASSPQSPKAAALFAPLRAFAASSWWNTPFPASAPVHSQSARYISDSQNPAHTKNYLNLVTTDWGIPIYHAASGDCMVSINPSKYGPAVSFRMPAQATQMPTSDAAMTVFDSTTNQVIGLHHAVKSSSCSWRAEGVDRYYLNSDGVAEKVGGARGNEGHRGISGAFRGVRYDEVLAGAVNHRLEVFWHATAERTPDAGEAYWPMTGAENGKGGIVPEGVVVRIKPSVSLTNSTYGLNQYELVIARALQNYGAVVGDNSGSGNNLKLQAKVNWSSLGVSATSLAKIPWSQWEFVKGGYRP